MLTIQVTIDRFGEDEKTRSISVPQSARIADIIALLLNQLGVVAGHSKWELWHAGAPLPGDSTLHQLKLDEGTTPIVFTLREELLADFFLDDAQAPASEPDVDAECEIQAMVEEDEAVVNSVDEADEQRSPGGAVATAKRRAASDSLKKASDSRRATARYYDRMNPERLFPLLVTITNDVVARAEGVQQISSGAFEVDRTAAIEVEPILPGCACYPPKVAARLDRGDVILTFYVVPQVLGTIEGAKIVVSQNHKSVAEMPLQIKVVKQTWVYLFSAASLVLPILSSLAKHFGLDFSSQHERGFDLYLGVAKAIVGISPFLLTTGLLCLAAVAYWLLRPRVRDCFWDVKVLKPDEMLRQIHGRMANEPAEAARDLVDLLQAHPAYQPAFLLYGIWHYKWKNFQAALQGFEKAIALGPIKAAQYQQAALSASRLGDNRKALSICKEATARLRQVPGAIWFNMGCYHARLQELDQVVSCLQKAIAAGFRKAASFREDPDLAPVRDRPEFQSLLEHPALTS